jgi:hypothetical protein
MQTCRQWQGTAAAISTTPNPRISTWHCPQCSMVRSHVSSKTCGEWHSNCLWASWPHGHHLKTHKHPSRTVPTLGTCAHSKAFAGAPHCAPRASSRPKLSSTSQPSSASHPVSPPCSLFVAPAVVRCQSTRHNLWGAATVLRSSGAGQQRPAGALGSPWGQHAAWGGSAALPSHAAACTAWPAQVCGQRGQQP